MKIQLLPASPKTLASALIVAGMLLLPTLSRALTAIPACTVDCSGGKCSATGVGAECGCKPNGTPSCTSGTASVVLTSDAIEYRLDNSSGQMINVLMANLGDRLPIPPLCQQIQAASQALLQNDLPGYLYAIDAIGQHLAALDSTDLTIAFNLVSTIP